MKKLFFLLSGALFLLLTSCSDTPTVAKKEPEKPPEPITGQSAIFKMYQVARAWGPDVNVQKMNTIALSDVPDVPRGKAAAWQAIRRLRTSPGQCRTRSSKPRKPA